MLELKHKTGRFYIRCMETSERKMILFSPEFEIHDSNINSL